MLVGSSPYLSYGLYLLRTAQRLGTGRPHPTATLGILLGAALLGALALYFSGVTRGEVERICRTLRG